MKRILVFLLVLIMLMPTSCSKADDDIKETPASSFAYRVKEDGTVFISEFTGDEKDVIIPDYIEGCPVTSIGVACFSGTPAENVVIPENVNLIPSGVFGGINLKTVTVKSKSVKFIGRAFDQCQSLESVTFMYENAEFVAPLYNLCPKLKEIVFLCDAPKCDNYNKVFADNKNAVVKYKKGTNGWDEVSLFADEQGLGKVLTEIE